MKRAAKPLYAPTIDGLISWLEARAPDETYCWWDVYDCLLCRFSAACGGPADGWLWFPEFFRIGCSQPWTYGAALKRARKERKYLP